MQQFQLAVTCCCLLIALTTCQGQERPITLPIPATAEQIWPLPSDTTYLAGVPRTIVRNIIQDSKGNIWLAAGRGVIQYDGASFSSLSEALNQTRFFAALEDRQGHLWLGSIGAGLYRYDGLSLQHYTVADGLAHDNIVSVYEDGQGTIWVATGGGISRYDGQRFQNLTAADGLSNEDVNTILEDSSGQFWIGTRGVALFYDGAHFSPITGPEGRHFRNVRHLIKDRQGNIWLGGQDGLWRYDGHDFQLITSNFTGYIHEDRRGNIWISAEGERPGSWDLVRYENPGAGMALERVIRVKTGEGMFFGILEAADGFLWAGTLQGVYRFRP
jgi:ligand-binding sensor domain-containing protein